MVLAFAIRTASALGDRFFGGELFASASIVGLMSNCVGALEPCANGCTLIGPAEVGLFFPIMDNAFPPSSFDGPLKSASRASASANASPPQSLRNMLILHGLMEQLPADYACATRGAFSGLFQECENNWPIGGTIVGLSSSIRLPDKQCGLFKTTRM